jgi:hypothetical protein
MGAAAQNNIFRNVDKDGKLTFYASKLGWNSNVKFFWYDVKDIWIQHSLK